MQKTRRSLLQRFFSNKAASQAQPFSSCTTQESAAGSEPRFIRSSLHTALLTPRTRALEAHQLEALLGARSGPGCPVFAPLGLLAPGNSVHFEVVDSLGITECFWYENDTISMLRTTHRDHTIELQGEPKIPVDEARGFCCTVGVFIHI